MDRAWTLLLLFSTLTLCAHSINILCIFPYQGKSHFFVFKTLIDELVSRGHNLTVISHFPEKSPPKNYHDISLAGTIKIAEDDVQVENSYKTILECGIFLAGSGIENCEVMLQNERVQGLVKQKQKFDVVLVEQFNSDCGLGLAYKLESPVVAITSHDIMPWHRHRAGIPGNPAYVNYHFLEGGTKPSLFQRIERVVFDVYFTLINSIYTQNMNQNSLTKYIGEVPPLEELARDVKFMLLYHNFVLTGSKLLPSNVIEVGGFHVGKAKPLTGDLKEFVDSAEHGIIYISFGSVAKSSTMPADKVKAVLGAMEELPQRFIWKWEDKTLLVDGKKLFVAKWLPQVDILGHPKTSAFFSHAGMLGTTEAIHHGVPIVAMPINGDQPSNGAAIEESGLGVQLQLRDLTKDNLVAAFKKVLNPQFRDRVKQISAAWHDRPLSPMDTAIFWIEYTARNSNFNFRTAAADVPMYQYLNIDIIAVFAIVIVLNVKLWISLCCKSNRKETAKKKAVKNKKRV